MKKSKEKESVKKLNRKAPKRKVSYKSSARKLINDFKETFKAFKTDDVGTNNINIQEIDDLKDGIKQAEKLEKEYYGIEKDKKEVNFGIERKSNNNRDINNNNNIKSKEGEEHKEEKNILDKLINKTNKVKSTNEIFNKKIEEKKKEKQNINNNENKNKSLDDMLKKLEENEKKNEEIQKKIIEAEDDIDNI